MVDLSKTIESITKSLPFGLGGALKKKEASQPLPGPAGEQPLQAPGAQDAGQIEIGIVQESAIDNAALEELKKQASATTERIEELESRLYKAERGTDTVKKENELLKGRMDQTDARILDMLSVYEVVSNQINPFVGSSKVISSTMEQLQEEMSTLKTQVATIGSDIKILARGKIDITKLVRTSISDADAKRRVDLTKLIRTAVQSKKTIKTQKGNELEYGP